MSRGLRNLAVVGGLVAVLGSPLLFPTRARAHEHRKVGPYEMVVGWADEPTFVGFKNGVQLILNDGQGKPVTDLGEDLKVEVIFADQKTAPLALERAFGKTFGRPGDYRAPIIPTRPGNYTFHFMGSVKDQKIDQSFTSSEKTFDPVAEASGVEFPAKDPSRADLAGRLERLGPRIDAATTAAQGAESASKAAGVAIGQVRSLSLAGIVLGAVGTILGLSGLRRRGRA
jgi:hypothetical protein